MEGTVPVIQDTYNELVKEMDQLIKVARPEFIESIFTARENGDLKENADYHAAREKQGHIEDRIRYLEDRIARSEIIKVDPKSAEHIVFGATVSLKNVSNGKMIKYQLVSSDAVDVIAGKISSESPIGRALIGSHRGEIVDVQTPRGLNQFEILDYE